jgi:hypothetical protein
VPDRSATAPEAARRGEKRESSAKPPATPTAAASESAGNRPTKTDTAAAKSAEEDGNGSSAAPPSARKDNTRKETDDRPPENADKPSASREASAAPASDEAPSRAPKTASTQSSERAAILRLLNDYEGAYSSLSEAKVRQLQPSFDGFPQTYRTVLQSVTLTILNPSIDIAPDGQSAIVKCLLSYDYVWKRGGLPPKGSLNVTWRLKKAGDSWVIVD